MKPGIDQIKALPMFAFDSVNLWLTRPPIVTDGDAPLVIEYPIGTTSLGRAAVLDVWLDDSCPIRLLDLSFCENKRVRIETDSQHFDRAFAIFQQFSRPDHQPESVMLADDSMTLFAINGSAQFRCITGTEIKEYPWPFN